MNVGVAHSEVNPNTRVMNSRGIWLTYALGVGILHIVLLSIPFFSVPVVWTLTNVIHNFVSSLLVLFIPDQVKLPFALQPEPFRENGRTVNLPGCCIKSLLKSRLLPVCVRRECTSLCTLLKVPPLRPPTKGKPDS